MSQSDQIVACQQIVDKLCCIEVRLVGETTQPTVILETLSLVTNYESDDYLEKFLSLLTQHTHDVCEAVADNSYQAALLDALAQSTREHPVWRSLFGAPNPNDGDCILDVVRQLLSKASIHQASPTGIGVESCKSALRIVANCCADNNNNRRSFLARHGLKPLLALLHEPEYLKLVIPVLYNVCSGDDDTDDEATEHGTDGIDAPTAEESTDVSVSFAAQCLADARSEDGRCATFELLLSYTDLVSDDEIEYLAELMEIAISPARQGLDRIFGSQAQSWKWSFTVSDKHYQTLTVAASLAERGLQCQLNVLRSVLYLLSQGPARDALLRKIGETFLDFIKLGDFSLHSEDDLTEYAEEIEACEKEFLQLFYEITGSSLFVKPGEGNKAILRHVLGTLEARTLQIGQRSDGSADQAAVLALSSGSGLKRNSGIQIACKMIMLAQWSAEQAFRDIILDSMTLPNTIFSILSDSEDQKLLYPLTMLISRLCVTGQAAPTQFESLILPEMKRLLVTGGLGLTIPYETVNIYRSVLKSRPDFLRLYTQMDEQNKSIMTAFVGLFDRTIEAGTKAAIGRLFIELLRTVFPLTKAMAIPPASKTGEDVMHNPSDDKSHLSTVATTFQSFLVEFATDTARILTFIVNESEPKEQRGQGWFGLGMLSVWEAGRFAILDSMENHSLNEAILESSRQQVESSKPARENLKIVLNNIKMYPGAPKSQKINECLSVACRNLGLISGDIS